MIIQLLRHRQRQRGGYLTTEDLRSVATEVGADLHHVQGLASYYPHFRMTPPAPVEVRVCRDMSCHQSGSLQLAEQLKQHAAETHQEGVVDVACVSCLGRCDRAPAVMINERLFVGRTEKSLRSIVDSHVNALGSANVNQDRPDMAVQADTDWQWLQQRPSPWAIDVYRSGLSDYRFVRDFVNDPRPNEVLEALKEAGLLGMGGAGARTYLKWHDVRQAKGQNKYIVANADESEPGTFKDRDLLLKVPHLVIEGAIIAGLVVGARRGWIYVRHEYPEQISELERELQRAYGLGALGAKIFGSQYGFELEVFVSPGGYIAGEQTALVEVLEDQRAEPRIRPPELMTNGYRNQPTLVNNVETFAWVPAIVNRDGAQWFAEQGRSDNLLARLSHTPARGRRFFSVSGDVQSPGVHEVSAGTTLGELIDHHCGGMASGKKLIAVALSGASGGFLPARVPLARLGSALKFDTLPGADCEWLDIRQLPLDVHIARSLNIMLGAGIVVYGTGANLLSEALSASRFFRHETCGKCVPCRIGCSKLVEMAERLNSSQVTTNVVDETLRHIVDLSQVMQATSICGIGQVAGNPLRSVIEYFTDAIVANSKSQRESGLDFLPESDNRETTA